VATTTYIFVQWYKFCYARYRTELRGLKGNSASRKKKRKQQESKDMSLVHRYERIMVCSAGWLAPLTSPAAGLAARILGLLWAFQLQG
jgi:hypothetical protein